MGRRRRYERRELSDELGALQIQHPVHALRHIGEVVPIARLHLSGGPAGEVDLCQPRTHGGPVDAAFAQRLVEALPSSPQTNAQSTEDRAADFPLPLGPQTKSLTHLVSTEAGTNAHLHVITGDGMQLRQP